MPAHTPHLLQPLDVICFSPLRRAYSDEIKELAHQGVYHGNKVDFLTIYTQIWLTVFTQEKIQLASGRQAYPLLSRSRSIVTHCRPNGISTSDNSKQQRCMVSRDATYGSSALAAGKTRTRPPLLPVTEPNSPSYPSACQRMSRTISFIQLVGASDAEETSGINKHLLEELYTLNKLISSL